ncbi:MAG: aminodeoxychorismate/anthranilate synthase component II [Sphingobacteriales bacterium]|nr:MAG: aminodeoxychorismate/anthranilate synthase component II [Sphingobacteriales bacterium]
MWVLIDNYDSFTYILHHYLLQTGNECKVFRNDEISVEELSQLKPSKLIISPGPETPLQAGICMEAIARFYDKIPILGICLGHQALGTHFGAQLVHAPFPMHGKESIIAHNSSAMFNNIPGTFSAMRYHSLVLQHLEGTGFVPTAFSTDDETIMAIQHSIYPCTGIQFHPESVGTPYGQQLITNWAAMYK